MNTNTNTNFYPLNINTTISYKFQFKNMQFFYYSRHFLYYRFSLFLERINFAEQKEEIVTGWR